MELVSVLHIFIISSILLLTDARFFNDDENFKYPEALDSISPPLEPTNGNPYGLPSPLSPPPLTSLPPLLSPGLIPPPSPFQTTPSIKVPPPFNFPIKSPPYSFTPKPISPPSFAPGPSPPNPQVHRPPHKKPQFAVWCVAKPTVPDLEIQEALDYACGSGADCKSIQANGACFQPNTLVAHASYAFNSYWQDKKDSGGTCDFGGTAMLVSVDPSYNKCLFTFK